MEFVCRVGTAEGRVLEEVHRARSEGDVRRELERQGYHVFAVRRRGIPSWLALPTLGGPSRGIPTRTLLIFNQELAALLRAGLPVLQALDLMLERMRDSDFRSILGQVRDQIRSGADLSEAFASFGDQFPPLYPSTLRAGERSGELEPVIRRYVRYQRLVLEARKRVISALVYPAVLIGLSALMILVMTIFVVPRFTGFYGELEVGELPILTRVIMGVSSFLRHNLVLVLVALAAGVLLLRRWTSSPAGQLAVARWRVRLPLLGSVFHRMALSEFCRSLSTLLAGGIPLVPALETAVGAVGNAYVRGGLEPATQKVREGSALAAALEGTGVAMDLAVDMVKVGEATGALDVMLSNVSDFFDEEVEADVQRILSLVEPAMLVLMGIIVAILLLAIYMPLFQAIGRVGV